MSERLPRATADEVIKEGARSMLAQRRKDAKDCTESGVGSWSCSTRTFFLGELGDLARETDRNEEGKRVTVPCHAGKTLHPKTLQSILRDADLSVERFRELLK